MLLDQVLKIIFLLLFLYLAIATLYYFIFVVASLFPLRRQRLKTVSKKRKMAVLIPGYKEDAVILEAAQDALKQDYPSDRFDVVVVADSFKPDTLESLSKLPIKLIEVSFEISSKSRSLNKAMALLDTHYDLAVLLDADNLMERDCLSRINESAEAGYLAIQCHRIAKNINTNYALLDAMSEEIANSTFRKGQRVLGLSSGLVGSGMAFDFEYFKATMSKIDAIGGFDKELELLIMGDGHSIEYLHDVYVYDEKVQNSEAFFNQRRRWISAQYRNLSQNIFKAFRKLLKDGNIHYFNKVIQWFFPPRTIYIITLLSVTLLTFIFSSDEQLQWAWGITSIFGIASFLLAIPRFLLTRRTLKALLSLPEAVFIMFKALFSLKGSNERFIHTQHTAVDAEEARRLHHAKYRV